MQLGHVKLNPTNDHVHPESKGGREIVVACIQCNMIKADMLPDQWEAFMVATPEWWKLNKWDIRRARYAMHLLTPGFEANNTTRRDRKAAGLTRSGRPKPVVVPPELVYPLRAPQPWTPIAGPTEAACAFPAAEASDTPSGSESAPAPHPGDLL
jgi:hypothetical protein